MSYDLNASFKRALGTSYNTIYSKPATINKDTSYEIKPFQDSGFIGFGIEDSRVRIKDSGFRILESRFKMQDSRFTIQDLGFMCLDFCSAASGDLYRGSNVYGPYS